MSKLTLSLIIITVFSVIFFLQNPDIDIVVSSWFYIDGEGFIYRKHPANLFMYYAIRVISVTIVLWSICSLLAYKFKPDLKAKWLFPRQYVLFILIAMFLGPGIVVHQGFKEYYERARPVNIEEFSGKKTYTAPFVRSDQGGKSFISGHTAMGFFVVAFAFLTTGCRRYYIYSAGLLFGMLSGVSRITQGGHFLSDTVFGALVTLLIIQFVKWLVIIRKEN